MRRKQPTLTERLAATLLELKYADGRHVIDREAAKKMTAKEICAQFEFDHGVHVAIGGGNHPTNLVPRLPAVHAEKTNKIDKPQIAKTKRIEQEQAEFRRRLLAVRDGAGDAEPQKKKKTTIPSSPLAGTKASGLKKRMDGTVERRR
jgi:hypothetical protein